MERCVCGEIGSVRQEIEGIPVVTCIACGIVRQTDLPFKDSTSLTQWYEKEYVYTHTYTQDFDTALKRLKAYESRGVIGGKCLDAGCGNGAFVDATQMRGYDVIGCEPRAAGNPLDESIYPEALEQVNFPTDEFDTVFVHDVLEHVWNPVRFMKEVHRVLKPAGTLVLEYPAFFTKEGAKHWKRFEHLWMMPLKRLVEFLCSVGFTLLAFDQPVLGKYVLYMKCDKKERKTVLLPPGIGDCYWSIVKLQALMERERLGDVVDVKVLHPKKGGMDKATRSFPFLKLFPFMHSTGEVVAQEEVGGLWREAYLEKGRTVFEDVAGCDYFVAYNGRLRHGESLDEVDTDLKCNWYPPMFKPMRQRVMERQIVERYGPAGYLVLYAPSHGMYKHWWNEMGGVDGMVNILNALYVAYNCPVLLLGAEWDVHDGVLNELINKVPFIEDYRGRTPLEEAFAILTKARLVFGFPSGLTIMGTVFKTQTLLVWNRYFKEEFWRNACPPDTLGKNYYYVDSYELDPSRVLGMVDRMEVR